MFTRFLCFLLAELQAGLADDDDDDESSDPHPPATSHTPANPASTSKSKASLKKGVIKTQSFIPKPSLSAFIYCQKN